MKHFWIIREEGAKKINLIRPGDWKSIQEVSVETAIARRQSRRSYTEDAINLD